MIRVNYNMHSIPIEIWHVNKNTLKHINRRIALVAKDERKYLESRFYFFMKIT